MKIIITLVILVNILIQAFYSLTSQTNLKLKNKFKKENHKKSLAEGILSNKKPIGHMEKITKIVQEIVYVPGKKPSGLPGSFVISEEEAKGKIK